MELMGLKMENTYTGNVSRQCTDKFCNVEDMNGAQCATEASFTVKASNE